MNKLKIQINNLQALERLIGGDSDVEIEIRNSVVQQFAEKHLKAIANSDPIGHAIVATQNEILRTISDQCSRQIATFKQSWSGSVTDVKLSAAITSEIHSVVRNMVDDKIRAAVESAISDWRDDKAIADSINKRFEHYTSDTINTEIKKRIEALKKNL